MPPGAQLPPQAQSTRVPPDELAAATAGKKTATGEQFFIIASVDLQKSQVLLKYPTEVTLLAHVDDKTKYLDSAGKPAKLSSLRAGDTVWVTLSNGASGAAAVDSFHVSKSWVSKVLPEVLVSDRTDVPTVPGLGDYAMMADQNALARKAFAQQAHDLAPLWRRHLSPGGGGGLG